MSLGYENAPIAQLISVFTILLGWFHGSSKILSLDLYKLGEGQLWRLLSSQIVFESTAEAIVGLMLIYTFRQFERQMGTRKFGFFVFLSLIISLFNVMTFQILLLSVDIHFVPASGPYFLIYAMLAIFYSRVPRVKSSGYQLFGMTISEKSWTYWLAGQLLVSGGFNSAIPALSGLLAGNMYDKDYCSIQTLRFPRPIESACSFCGKLVVSLIPSNPTATAAGAGGGGGGGRAGLRNGGYGRDGLYGGEGMGGGGGGGMAQVHTPPSEEAVETLMGMGFDRPAVLAALQSNGNSVEAAANMLLR